MWHNGARLYSGTLRRAAGGRIRHAIEVDVWSHLFRVAGARARQRGRREMQVSDEGGGADAGGASQSLACSKHMCRLKLKTPDAFRAWAATHHPDLSTTPDAVSNEHKQEFVEALRCHASGFYCGFQDKTRNKSLPAHEAEEMARTGQAPSVQDVSSVNQQALIHTTIDHLAVDDTEKERIRTEYRAAQDDLQATVKKMKKNVNDHVLEFAHAILQFFRYLWDEVQEIVGGWMADPKESELTAQQILDRAKKDDKSWFSWLKRGTKAVGSFLYDYVWPVVKFIGSTIWSVGKTLASAGFTVALWILQNPSIAKLALILAIHYRNVLCRQLGDWWYENRPLDMASEAVTWDLASGMLEGAAPGVVRTFAKSSLFDQAFDLVGKNAGSIIGGVVNMLPGGFLVAGAAQAATEMMTTVSKEAAREALTFYTYQRDLQGGFTLLVDLIDMRRCWSKFQSTHRQIAVARDKRRSFATSQVLPTTPSSRDTTRSGASSCITIHKGTRRPHSHRLLGNKLPQKSCRR